jgi:hypothetical protein
MQFSWLRCVSAGQSALPAHKPLGKLNPGEKFQVYQQNTFSALFYLSGRWLADAARAARPTHMAQRGSLALQSRADPRG